jgi:pimeloyl-ACP methyl ester carboxylesterase
MSISPFVLLPGFLCDERLWSNQVAALSPHAPVSTVDFRHCKSLDEMVSKIERVTRSEKVNLVGFSMGGYLAQCFTSRFPDRIATLTIIASTGNPLSEFEVRLRTRMESLLSNSRYRGISDKELMRYVHSETLQNKSITDLIQTMSADNTSEMYLNQMRATLHRETYKGFLRALPNPITLIGGVDDQIAPKAELEQFHHEVPHSKLYLFSQCGHYIPLEKPDSLNSIILAHNHVETT